MIRSMTAFSRLEVEVDWASLCWEIRTVNHRYSEISLRLPEECRILEGELRKQIQKVVGRGKVDASLRIKMRAVGQNRIDIDQEEAAAVIAALTQINSMSGDTGINAVEVLKWPGVIKTADISADVVKKPVMALLDQALTELRAMREREGEKLKALIAQRCEQLRIHVAEAREYLPAILSARRAKLVERVEGLVAEIDQDRLEQELVLIAQKMDVEEELDRLEVHISEVLRVLEQDEPVGRRLDFLMQELNREGNTMNSKSIDAKTTNLAVNIKVLIEQMREQVQNIE